VRIYLDACCLNRLTDDQTQSRIAEMRRPSKRSCACFATGRLSGCPAPFEAETSNNPDPERRHEVEVLLSFSDRHNPAGCRIIRRATELEATGYGGFDALHMSSAEAAVADVCSLLMIDSSGGLDAVLARRACGS